MTTLDIFFLIVILMIGIIIIEILSMKKVSIITTLNIIFLFLMIFSSSIVSYSYITPISVDPQKLSENVSINNPEKFTIAIKNTNPWFPIVSGSLILKYKINGFDASWLKLNNALLESTTTKIARGETEFVQITIDVSNDTIPPGTYNGEILILNNEIPSDDQPYKIIQTSLKINKPPSNMMTDQAAHDKTEKRDNITDALKPSKPPYVQLGNGNYSPKLPKGLNTLFETCVMVH